MENQQQSTALATRLQQAEMIKNAVVCFIPETDEQKQTLFTKNCLFYLVKNKGFLQGDKVCLPKANGEILQIDLFEYLQKMYLVSKSGLSLVDGEFTPVVYDGGEVVIVPDYRAEKRVAESKGLVITFMHGRRGDTFTIEANPLKHTFTTKERAGEFKSIKKVTKISKKGKEYTVTESESDIIWYACVAEVIETKEVLSYVESTENILLRANPKTLDFYKNPNSQENMFEKFVLRQLVKRLPSNLRCVDFDKWEGKFEQVEYEEVQEAPTASTPKESKPKTPPKQELKPLVEGSETWFKMIESIKAHKVTIEQIARKYDIEPIRAQIEQLFVTYKETPEANEKGGETAETDENSPLNLNL